MKRTKKKQRNEKDKSDGKKKRGKASKMLGWKKKENKLN